LAKRAAPAGFGPGAFAFFRELAAEQNKPWFEANRDRYDRLVRLPAAILAEEVGAKLAARELPLSGDAKRSLFRIHRDVRFSKDKRPYKTHAGLVWMRPGCKKISPGFLYLHIADDGCFVAAGFYDLDRPLLDAVRRAVCDGWESFSAAVQAAGRTGLSLDTADGLTRLPRGFEHVDDPALAAVVKARHLLLRRPLTRAEVGSPALADLLADSAAAALPFLTFGWDAIAERAPAPAWSRMG
jgi:uncharacterized protein (TIGR02453 family)